ncbi:MAG: helicase, partial [Neisseriaceae bacterium]
EGVLARRNEREVTIRADQLVPSSNTGGPNQENGKSDDRSENEYQIPYVAFSKVSDPTTMIPANLSGVIYEALNGIKNRRGDIDEYVGHELELTVAQLKERFVAEQVDALAMIFDAQDSRKGFLLADRMGVGKGRVLAAAAVYAHSKGQVPVFFSVTSNLFTDLLERDIADIGFRDRFKNVLILNGDAKTLDANGNVSVKPPPAARLNAMFSEQQLPRGTDLVMLTYSQVSRETGKSKKADFLANVATHTPLALLLDESHNAAGESFTSTNIQRMIDANSQHGAVLYASATPIKGAKNLAVYSKILPAGVNVDPDELLRAVQADPLSLQEALMHEIAQQGSTVCRSLDDSNLQMEFRLSPRADQHRAVADQFSYIMQAMCYLSGDVAKIVDERNKEFEKELEKIPAEEREGQRMTATSLNFASRLYNVNRQFLMALQADDVLEYTIGELKADKKPVITIQATGESLLNDFVGTGNEAAQELTSDAGKKAKKQTFNDVLLDKPITFSDLLRKYLDRISYITTQTGYGNYTVTPCISDEFIESRNHIARMIDAFPELPMTPIDYLRTKLQEKGYSMGEVSGRSLQVDYLPTGGLRIYKRPDAGDKTAVNRIVKSFNNGDTDVLLLTGAGSTGLSAHASPSVGSDIRPRVMIKLELQAAIDKEVQIGGRINRRGQVTPPTYLNPLSGLPAQDRLMMMFNAKSRNLSSSSEANRDSKDIIREAPDLLNVVGDEAARTLLYDNRELAGALDITLPEAEESHRQGPLWYANKLSSRISLVPVARQESIYAEWQSRFTDLLERYKAEGRNPLEVKVYNWKAHRVSRSVFHGEPQSADGESRSMLEMPVYLTTLRYDQVMTPLNASQVDMRIEANRSAVNLHPMVDPVSGGVPDITHYLANQREQLLRDSVAKRFNSLEQALADKEPNAAKEMAAKLDWLETNLPRLRVGAVFYQNDIHGNEQPNVVVRFTPPSKPEHFTRLSEYTLYTVQPGHDSMDLRYLSSLQTQSLSLQRLDFARNSVAREIFDTAPAGVIPRTARILDGNLFEAVNINLRQHVGHKIVYTAINPDTGKSEKHHGILVNSGISDRQLEAIPERVRDQQTLLRILLESEKPIATRPDGDAYHKDTPLAFFPSSGRASAIVMSVPAEKSKGGRFYTDPVISRIPGKEDQNLIPLSFERSVNRMVAHVQTTDLPALLDYLVTERGANFYVRAEHLKPLREDRTNTVQQAPKLNSNAAALEL